MGIPVKALKLGFYKGRRRPGDVFEIDNRKQLGSWMEEQKPSGKSAGGKPSGKSAESETE